MTAVGDYISLNFSALNPTKQLVESQPGSVTAKVHGNSPCVVAAGKIAHLAATSSPLDPYGKMYLGAQVKLFWNPARDFGSLSADQPCSDFSLDTPLHKLMNGKRRVFKHFHNRRKLYKMCYFAKKKQSRARWLKMETSDRVKEISLEELIFMGLWRVSDLELDYQVEEVVKPAPPAMVEGSGGFGKTKTKKKTISQEGQSCNNLCKFRKQHNITNNTIANARKMTTDASGMGLERGKPFDFRGLTFWRAFNVGGGACGAISLAQSLGVGYDDICFALSTLKYQDSRSCPLDKWYTCENIRGVCQYFGFNVGIIGTLEGKQVLTMNHVDKNDRCVLIYHHNDHFEAIVPMEWRPWKVENREHPLSFSALKPKANAIICEFGCCEGPYWVDRVTPAAPAQKAPEPPSIARLRVVPNKPLPDLPVMPKPTLKWVAPEVKSVDIPPAPENKFVVPDRDSITIEVVLFRSDAFREQISIYLENPVCKGMVDCFDEIYQRPMNDPFLGGRNSFPSWRRFDKYGKPWDSLRECEFFALWRRKMDAVLVGFRDYYRRRIYRFDAEYDRAWCDVFDLKYLETEDIWEEPSEPGELGERSLFCPSLLEWNNLDPDPSLPEPDDFGWSYWAIPDFDPPAELERVIYPKTDLKLSISKNSGMLLSVAAPSLVLGSSVVGAVASSLMGGMSVIGSLRPGKVLGVSLLAYGVLWLSRKKWLKITRDTIRLRFTDQECIRAMGPDTRYIYQRVNPDRYKPNLSVAVVTQRRLPKFRDLITMNFWICWWQYARARYREKGVLELVPSVQESTEMEFCQTIYCQLTTPAIYADIHDSASLMTRLESTTRKITSVDLSGRSENLRMDSAYMNTMRLAYKDICEKLHRANKVFRLCPVVMSKHASPTVTVAKKPTSH